MQSSSTKKIVFLIILAAIVIGLAYLLANNTQNKQANNNGNPEGQTEEVDIDYVDLEKASSEEEKLPAGWPADVPLETSGIQEAYTAELPGTEITVATVVYVSEQSPSQKYQQYLDYMTQAGYSFAEEGKIAPSGTAPGSLYGTKDNNDLSVSIAPQDSGSYIHINYMIR